MSPVSMRKKKADVDQTGSTYTKMCRGCRLCQKGAKMVLFVTGACGRDCFYCPLSAQRKGFDNVYANERLVKTDDDIVTEAKRMGALGTGITGGEPLLKLDRTLHYIKLLKDKFGKRHHIHLYTGIAPADNILRRLRKAGLDEIRFHPPVDDWHRFRDTGFYRALKASLEMGIDAGVEIPAIEPVPEIVRAVHELGAFLNLNELEFSETNCEAMKGRGYLFDNSTSNAARRSQEVGYEIVLNILANTRTRYCSSRFKDAVQLRERLKRIARITARPFDGISADGTIIYGEIVGNITDALNIIKTLKVPRRLYRSFNDRIEIAWWLLDDIKGPGVRRSIIERYPMEGGLVVEKIPL